ncbi:hydrogenase maturation nickel metallochaperone H ypA [Desulfonema ishimotonii]|uniref:Hydrogenase maturation factor HypA n=1 Tax=Desulfonema ishimotonii TaxID=45657 RepID=A0A401FZR0_9BACT|nr:hydrogenase maturation nickel metallochaperone HypA [Desulfonema ishimotonii]GBC62448.1 hydrogenase maturation nickel metallochaperone H ypA [Desulfonema ishimotonii]
MHEMGIAMQVLEIAKASIPEEMGDAQVEQVNLKVGKLAAVVPDSLRFCFEVISRDTTFAGATLNIEEVPVVAQCSRCQHRWTVSGSPVFRCSACDSGEIRVLSGRELEVASIEVAD